MNIHPAGRGNCSDTGNTNAHGTMICTALSCFHSEGYIVCQSFLLSVHLSITTFSVTTRKVAESDTNGFRLYFHNSHFMVRHNTLLCVTLTVLALSMWLNGKYYICELKIGMVFIIIDGLNHVASPGSPGTC